MQRTQQCICGLPADQMPVGGRNARGLHLVVGALVHEGKGHVLGPAAAAVGQHVGVQRTEHALVRVFEHAHGMRVVAARDHVVVGTQQRAVAVARAAEQAHEVGEMPQRHAGDRHDRLRDALLVLPPARPRMAHAEFLHRGQHEGRGPHGALRLLGLREPVLVHRVVLAAKGLDARRLVAPPRVFVAVAVGRRLVLPGLGGEVFLAQHLPHHRHGVAHGHQEMAVVAAHADAVDFGCLFQRGPEQLGGLLAVVPRRMQVGRVGDGAHQALGLGQEGEDVVFDAVVVDLVRRLAHLRHQLLRPPVAEGHQQQRLQQRDRADDRADVDPEAPQPRVGCGR
ncbi:hypothetical protein FQZ97_817690 [compost metagenome]